MPAETVVRIPAVNPTAYETAADFVLALYRALDWNPATHRLDPTKIRLHPTTWQRYASILIRRHGVQGGLTWMNYGPGGSEGVGRSELVVAEGALCEE